MALVDVLIPTYGRKTGLAVVLTSLLGQTFTAFDVVISDQTEDDADYLDDIEIATLVRALRWHGHTVTLHRHLPRRGMAEQRQFLLEQSRAPYVHYLDDDVLLDPPVLGRMLAVLRAEGCGFVGCPATGLGYLDDVRPEQQHIELWQGPVRPEPFGPEAIPWERISVNNAANPLHLEQRLVRDGHPLRYKVAWVGGANVLFDRAKLLSVGGFAWWRRLPREHAGEEVVAQFLLLHEYGGCGILPSGTYHLGLPTTIEDRSHNATELYEALLGELAGPHPRPLSGRSPAGAREGGYREGQGAGAHAKPSPL
ncbi:MAG TPA: glycosyltransferase family A protein [Thermomicrobiaceae bacterium]|nr:glycosyltransferase family A protein [Thermomicrobiaceae bacterium]